MMLLGVPFITVEGEDCHTPFIKGGKAVLGIRHHEGTSPEGVQR